MAKIAKSTSKKRSTPKAVSKKRTNKKKTANKPFLAALAAAGPGNCLSLSRAGRIVQEAANGPHDIDKTLEEVGFISQERRDGFRRDVHNGVRNEGCHISENDIPNGADDTLRKIRDTIQERAD